MMRLGKLVFLVALLLVSMSSGAKAGLIERNVRYSNEAEFICGLKEQEDGALRADSIFLSFYNPNAYPVMLNNLITLYEFEGSNPSEHVEQYLNILVSPKSYFDIDCNYINKMFFPKMVELLNMPRRFKGLMKSKNIRYLEVAMEFTSFTKMRDQEL